MATVLLLASRQPDRIYEWIGALGAALLVCGLVLVLADRIRKVLGDSVVSALEKLMGLVLTAIAVEMVLAGLKRYFIGGVWVGVEDERCGFSGAAPTAKRPPGRFA
jgi:small neutral amino acid transporter SnatA (MarC family)